MNTVEAEMEEQLEKVQEVLLKIGVLSCVHAGTLEHVYSHMIADGPLRNSRLRTEMVDVLAECEECGQKFKVENYRFICPECDKPTSNILEGKELRIVKIILEETEHEEINE
jgi:hydrogenase nickel incorporation protein HypA/HybF